MQKLNANFPYLQDNFQTTQIRFLKIFKKILFLDEISAFLTITDRIPGLHEKKEKKEKKRGKKEEREKEKKKGENRNTGARDKRTKFYSY